jgi:hypothetical protein
MQPPPVIEEHVVLGIVASAIGQGPQHPCVVVADSVPSLPIDRQGRERAQRIAHEIQALRRQSAAAGQTQVVKALCAQRHAGRHGAAGEMRRGELAGGERRGQQQQAQGDRFHRCPAARIEAAKKCPGGRDRGARILETDV